jgi:DNA replication protein DnaC
MRTAVITRDLLVAQTRALKRPGVARVFASLARQARDAHWPHEDYLHEALSAELASRHESVIRQRLREARFPEVKTLDTFDFTAADGISATQIHALARGEWVTAPENLILAGPIGTGKTHLAIALGVEATKPNVPAWLAEHGLSSACGTALWRGRGQGHRQSRQGHVEPS